MPNNRDKDGRDAEYDLAGQINNLNGGNSGLNTLYEQAGLEPPPTPSVDLVDRYLSHAWNVAEGKKPVVIETDVPSNEISILNWAKRTVAEMQRRGETR